MDPVILATGHTYDRENIEHWIQQGNRSCPMTGMKLRHTELTPNFALRNAIREWAEENDVTLPEKSHSTTTTTTTTVTPAAGGGARAGHDSDDDTPPAAAATPPHDVVLVADDEGVVLSGHEEIVWALEKRGIL